VTTTYRRTTLVNLLGDARLTCDVDLIFTGAAGSRTDDQILIYRSRRSDLGPDPAQPPPLMVSAVPAHAAVHVRGVGAVLEIVTAGCGEGGFQRCRPGLVGFG
jgi:hypothetical protein